MTSSEPAPLHAPPSLPWGDKPESFEVGFTTPGLDVTAIETVVCLPTFKRPGMLSHTLASLLAQQGQLAFAILVIENEGMSREGAAQAMAMLADTSLNPRAIPGMVIIEPNQGNCNAYNAAWRCTLARFPHARFICGIDDDEQADPQWLMELVSGAEQTGAGIIGGSVTPVFEDRAGERFRGHPIFRSHYQVSGPVPMIYSSANYLIRREVIAASPWPFLDLAFNFTGGGDTDFFARAKAKGITFAWRQEASMTETMPTRRTQPDWIAARGYRNGMISALIARKNDPSPAGRARRVAHSLALLAAAPFRSLALAIREHSLTIGLYHWQVAAGRIMAEFGITNEQYRAPEKN
jgi:glycosyltransferase involved in cell wall biosynthesis